MDRKPSSSSSTGPPAPVIQRKTRDSDLCLTSDIPKIPPNCIDELNSHFLGKGTFGVVEKTKYRKTRDDTYRPAAIKYASATHLSILKREAKHMWNLRNHVNIIKIYGMYESHRNGQGLVMEYMDCGCVADLIYDRKNIEYKMDHVASWMYQLSSAVNFFHSKDQIHRDLKLQNMLLSHHHRTLKICDFGTFTSIHQSMTSNRGSPITMAPEIFRCEPYNMKADIFSIGIIMWQMIARDHPYTMNMPITPFLYNVATRNLRPHEIECNPILSNFYKRCWSDNPASRPTSADCVEYFRCLRSEYPNGNVPLWDPASGASNTVKIPKSQPGGRSPLPLPKTEITPDVKPKEVAPAKVQETPALLPDTLKVPKVERQISNEEEKQKIFMTALSNEDTRPIDPNEGDESSLELYHQHCLVNLNYAEVLLAKKEAINEKHKLVQKWAEHERTLELLERIACLEQEIAYQECNNAKEKSSFSVRM
ncbi:Protein kinase domain-containing protein [Caenorhabditis elegans]|uniref:Protein kinase domain-containing protein n=1 Tax=Caenorhabditis elegans TaxID=6239 RepID=Q9NF64_CAEEL|nr:mitogen-activated protein kinase kinase kinase [Caenorhabditis elegans]CAB55004.2 mitogen-activated protein kinase kinase kinase [Caenorhabditis elegans]|eukprot:NP_502888.2 Uncharacterized protein CELE_Y105C5A.24 [Caenorhabditis elegans]